MQYVAGKRSVALPGHAGVRGFKLVLPGQPIPEGIYSAKEIAAMAANGTIVEPKQLEGQPAKLPSRKGKWCHDPASLAGKSAAELLTMVREVDAKVYDGLTSNQINDRASLVLVLTADFEQAFAPAETPAATDKTVPAADKIERARRAAKG